MHERLQNYKLYVKLNKYKFFKTEIEFLSSIINTDGIKINL